MKRIHLFEFEDQTWFPSFLRNYVTDFLQFLSNKAKVYESVVPEINQALKQTNSSKIIDLGSGSGGGLLWLATELKKENMDLQIVLTDLYPNETAFNNAAKSLPYFMYHNQPVNATNVPETLKGFRTMFLSFHHFKPKQGAQILQNAVSSNEPIGIFEIQDRSVPSIIAMLLSPISVLLTTPFIKPFSLLRLLFTYIIPIIPIIVLWDGVVSSLRTYSVDEMQQLIKSVENNENFLWQIEKKKAKMGFVIYTIGIPKKQNSL